MLRVGYNRVKLFKMGACLLETRMIVIFFQQRLKLRHNIASLASYLSWLLRLLKAWVAMVGLGYRVVYLVCECVGVMRGGFHQQSQT